MKIPYEWIWLSLFVVFLITEGASNALITIWFAAGALIAVILAFFHVNLTIQIVVFFVVSIVLLISTRPIVKKYFEKNKEQLKTNVNSMIGKKAIVTKQIKEHEFGEVKVDGQIWSAISENEKQEIDVDENVIVASVSGVKLIVKKP